MLSFADNFRAPDMTGEAHPVIAVSTARIFLSKPGTPILEIGKWKLENGVSPTNAVIFQVPNF